MNKFLEKLLKGREVEWRKLGEVCEILRGKRLTKKELNENGKYPVYHGGIIPLGYYDKFNRKANQTMIINTGSVGEVAWSDVEFWSSDGTFVIETGENIIDKYLYYFLKTTEFYLKSQKREGGVPTIEKNAIINLKIPIPPIDVQEEIVTILDKFTELNKELNKELNAREKQYKYYLNKLLTFGDDVEWKSLDAITVKISSGGTPKTSISKYYNGNIPWLRTQEVNFNEIFDTDIKITEEGLKNSSAKWIPKNCIIIAMYGATVGKVAINKIPLTTNQACANIQIDEKIADYRYVFYFLLSQYEYIKSLGAGSQTNINAGIVKKIKIPIPPIEKQKEIVEILDKFNTITNSITKGLPKEIELRQKQYEYYRNLLLDFKKE